MTKIAVADALEWLDTIEHEADLVLTDPPHLDTFRDYAEYQWFCWAWVPKAMRALKPGGTLLHSCGTDPVELVAYLNARVPDQILVWPHEPSYTEGQRLAKAHHHFLLYRKPEAPPLRWSGSTDLSGLAKPDPLWKTLITTFVDTGALVLDPFCGRGEIPFAARECERDWIGCEINRESVAYCRSLGL